MKASIDIIGYNQNRERVFDTFHYESESFAHFENFKDYVTKMANAMAKTYFALKGYEVSMVRSINFSR